MLRKRTIQTNAAKDSVRVSPSFGDPGALSGALAGGSFVGGVAGAMALADSPYPRPGSEPAEIRRYFRGNAGAARLSVVGQLISAVVGNEPEVLRELLEDLLSISHWSHLLSPKRTLCPYDATNIAKVPWVFCPAARRGEVSKP
jgi:hypothetical protein